jgi:hypothetical protein
MNRAAGILLILVLLGAMSIAPLFPRVVMPASAPPSQFSAERAMAHLPAIAPEPHATGSPAQARVRDYLVQQLTSIGLETQVQRTRGIENVLARLHGSDPTGAVLVLRTMTPCQRAPVLRTMAAARLRCSRRCAHWPLVHSRATTSSRCSTMVRRCLSLACAPSFMA